MEIPQYSVKPNVNRMVAWKIVQLIVLAVLFYVALWLNLQLGFNVDVPFIVNVLIVAVIVLAVIIELVKFHVVYSQYDYLFYTNRIILKQRDKLENFFFKDFESSAIKINLLDKMMSTGTIVLNKKIKIGPVNKPKRVYAYLLKLMDYYNKTKDSYMRQESGNQEFYRQTEIRV